MRNNIRKMLAIATITALTIAQIPSVAAQERAQNVRWGGSYGDWVVGDTGLGCFMGTRTGGMMLLLGFERRSGKIYVGVSNEAWRSLTPGRELPLALEFNDDTSWRGTAVVLGDPVFLLLPVANLDFLVDFASKKSMSIVYAGKYVTSLPLTGSRAAVLDLLRCEEAGGRGYYRADPFNDDDAAGGPVEPPRSPSRGEIAV